MPRQTKLAICFCALAGLMFVAEPALAHPGHSGHEFVDGWWHPLTGADHLLAMIAVGLLAVRAGGRALWLTPAVFLAFMLAGGLIAAGGVALPGVELGIAASVLVLGLAIACAPAGWLPFSLALVALFAIDHGYAHAIEMSPHGSLPRYFVGCLMATGMLHAAGIAGGVALARWARPQAVRVAGGAIAAAGMALVFAGV